MQRSILITSATVATLIALGGTALAANAPGRRDDRTPAAVATDDATSPSPSVSTSDDHGGLRDGTGTDDTSPTAIPTTPTPTTTPTYDDHGGDRHRSGSGHGADDGATHDSGDDHGGSGKRH